jgi:hypothetical protein
MSSHPIRNRRTVVVNHTLSVASPSFTLNVGQLVNFRPKYMIIRQLLYCNITGADSGTYLIWSNIRSDYIGAVYVGIQGVSLTPQTIIAMPFQSQSIDFRVDPANPAFGGPTGCLTMTLEFVEDEI